MPDGTRPPNPAIGSAARNVNGAAILYADRMTDSLAKAIAELD